MSFSVMKVVSNVGKQIISQSRHTATPSRLTRSVLCLHKERQFTQNVGRSMYHHFCQSADNLGSPNVTKLNLKHAGKTCSCGNRARLHTEGDKELSTFLQQEIDAEKTGKETVKDIPGFILTTDGTDATLTKAQDGETVKVTFNINHSVEAEVPIEEGAQDDEAVAPPMMRAYPEFAVEITKDGKSFLSVKCHFADADFAEDEALHAEDLENKDFFLIDEVSIHSGTPSDKTYSVGSEVMDGTLYDMLFRMLNEHGIDNAFAEGLSDIASHKEHGHYINFLQDLKHFVDC